MQTKVTDLAMVKQRLLSAKQQLENFGVLKLSVFGSFSRNMMTDESDVDILVEFSRSIGLFEFARLKIFLSELMGRDVDLVTPDALLNRMRSSILKEAVNVAATMD